MNTKKQPSIRLIAVLFACAAMPMAALPAAAEPQPAPQLNIIMLISEDQGWRDSGCYGNPDLSTPHIDKLAEEGMLFTHAFAGSQLCSPARAVIDTGLMPFRNGGHVFGGHIRRGTQTLAHRFRDLGYQTANFGKFSKHPKSRFPYEVVNEQWKMGEEQDAGLSGKVDEFLGQRETERPLFLQINTGGVHMPWVENTEFDLASLCLPPHLVDTAEARDALADYYTSVQVLDTTIGRITAILDKHGYRDNTLLLYTADHGANLPFAKWTLYDEGIRIPLIVRFPGAVPPASRTDAMVSHADLMPTLMEAVGGTPPADIDGKSFLAVLKGEQEEHHEFIFASHTGNAINYPDWKANWSPARTIRSRTHQYILNLNPNYTFTCHITGCGPDRQPGAWHPIWDSWVELAKTDATARARVDAFLHRPQHELYDLTKDPFEKVNLAEHPAYAEILKRLQTKLATWRATQGDDLPVSRNLEEYLSHRPTRKGGYLSKP